MSALAGVKIDRNAVHRVLWRRADRFGRVRVQARSLAEELGVSYWNFTVVLKSMAGEGRMRQIGGSERGPKTYVVENPDIWA